jgi:hypothetical protein
MDRRRGMNSHELYAELERVRRDISTLRYRMSIEADPDWLGSAGERLEASEAAEQELVRRLADSQD